MGSLDRQGGSILHDERSRVPSVLVTQGTGPCQKASVNRPLPLILSKRLLEHVSNVKCTKQPHSKASDGEALRPQHSELGHPQPTPRNLCQAPKMWFSPETEINQISYLGIKPRTFTSATQHPNHVPQWLQLKKNLLEICKGK